MREKVQIPAMRERDMRLFFMEHGLSDAIDRGELECASCGVTLTWNDIAGFVLRNGRPVVYCGRCGAGRTKGRDCIQGETVLRQANFRP
jgi:hypothetical protein